MRLATILLCILLLPGVADAKKGKKKKKGQQDSGPKVGWVAVGEGGGSCFYPPDFSGLASGPKRMEWQNTRNAMMSQWRGERGDGVSFDDRHITALENVLLGTPDRVEEVAKQNAAACEKAMQGGGMDAWAAWLKAVPSQLTAGDCPTPPMEYTLFDYLSVNNDWHIPVEVCKGDRIVISATENDYFRLDGDAEWINAAGDASGEVTPQMPCNHEMCKPGMLIMRFRTSEGMDQILPVGLEREFLAPGHGTITVMINDNNLSDNEWRTKRGIQDHTGIEYSPAGE